MSYPPPKPLPTHLRNNTTTTLQNPTSRQPSGASTASTASGTSITSGGGPSPALTARIAAKQRELADLRDLRDLSAQVADQLTALRDKLATLSDGTQAVALVLANWHSVLQAISMAAGKVPAPQGGGEDAQAESEQRPLPETLVRIPVTGEGIAGAMAAAAGGNEAEGEAGKPGGG